MNLTDFVAKYNINRDRLWSLSEVGIRIGSILFFGYVASTVMSAVLVSSVLKVLTKPNAPAGRPERTEGSAFALTSPNYREIRKAITDRNIFNSDGKFPEEKDADPGRKGPSNAFDINGVCQKSKLDLQLLGTIYLGNRLTSLATMKDKDYPEADIYRVGDAVIGNDQAVIAAVERQRVIINNSGIKECIELVIKGPEGAGSSLPPEANGGVPGGPTTAPTGEALEGCSNVSLEGTYVEQQLGQGFQNIITKARLVPNTADGKVSGFKIFAIDQSSLFGKLCLQNNDVIVQVNDTSLQQPEQGFALFEAFQNEKDIRISITRNSQPRTITVHIK